MESVNTTWLDVDACIANDIKLFKRPSENENHALLKIDVQKLPHDFVAFVSVSQAHTSVAISPKWLIYRDLVVDGLVYFIVFLPIKLVSGMWHTDDLRHIFLSRHSYTSLAGLIVNFSRVKFFSRCTFFCVPDHC